MIRCVTSFVFHDLQVDIFVTDRHVQINKWVRENMPATKHYFDVWHVAKGTCFMEFTFCTINNTKIKHV